jgi:hypothetical protein
MEAGIVSSISWSRLSTPIALKMAFSSFSKVPICLFAKLSVEVRFMLLT